MKNTHQLKAGKHSLVAFGEKIISALALRSIVNFFVAVRVEISNKIARIYTPQNYILDCRALSCLGYALLIGFGFSGEFRSHYLVQLMIVGERERVRAHSAQQAI